VALIVAFVPDLMLASRVGESLRAAGHEVVPGNPSSPAGLPAEADLVVCDLDTVDPGEVAALPVPALGFYSHVDVETRRLALDAGIDVVVPRSRMARELPQLIEGMV
jgi:hypothetical protein